MNTQPDIHRSRTAAQWINNSATGPGVPGSYDSPQAEASHAVRRNFHQRPSLRLSLVLAGFLGFGFAVSSHSFTLYDHNMQNAVVIAGKTYGTPPTTFSDIANLSDHWSWDDVANTITIHYYFDPSFSLIFPTRTADIKAQVVLAMNQWSTASTALYGTIDSYARRNSSFPPGPFQSGQAFEAFMDIRSATLHELGHILGLAHPDEGWNLGASPPKKLNFRHASGGGVGSLTAQPNTTFEVMDGHPRNPGWINHILSWDELDAYRFLYPGKTLKFEEVHNPADAELVFRSEHKPFTTIVCEGVPEGTLRNPALPMNGIQIVSGTISYNDACFYPIGFRTLGWNWDMQTSLGSADTHTVVVRIHGTDNPTLFAVWNNFVQGDQPNPNYVFQAPTHIPAGPNAKDDLSYVWSNPANDIPPNKLFHVGVELDVWDWQAKSASAIAADGFTSTPLPYTLGHGWGGVVSGLSANAKSRTSSGTCLTTVSGTNYSCASGFLITASELPETQIADLRIADVTGMGLALADLNRSTLNKLEDNGRVTTVTNFGIHTLGSSAEFIVLLQGSVDCLPLEVRTNGNYFVLDQPDLVGREVFMYWESSNDQATIGNFGLLDTPAVVSVTPAPSLRIQTSVTNSVLIAWPAPSTGFVLQQTATLGAPSWTTVTNAPTVVGNENQVIAAAGAGNRFYRLCHP